MKEQPSHLKRSLIIAASIALAGGGAFALISAIGDNATPASAAPQVPAEGEAPNPVEYPVNGAGQTYGSLADAPSDEEAPDLILVELEDGSKGYVLKTDLFEAENANVKSPEEAVALEEERAAASTQDLGPQGESTTGLPVYNHDGELDGSETWGGVDLGI